MESAPEQDRRRRIDAARRDRVVRAAAAAGLVGPRHAAAGFLDVDGVRRTIADLHAAFGPDVPVLHAFAVKAAALVPVLRLVADAGMGCEVASPGELALARAAGLPADRIVLDSPAKTAAELAEAVELGVAVNADNLQELQRIAALPALGRSGSVFGLRVNPQVGAGTIGAMSTASEHSKFGEPLRDPGARARVLDAFDRYPWLTRLHVHVGSQGCWPDLIASGIRATWELAEEINRRAGRRRVTSLDLGGGLPVNFADDEVRPSHAEYAALLRAAVPGLFSGEYTLVTEFGRSVVAKNGFTAARVEYTKEVGGRRIALTHAGAHLATRTVFMPDAWPLRVGVHRPDGTRREGPEEIQDVAGPCCFAGDVVARGRALPRIEPGDLVVLHDTGGYYTSAHWAYNSLARPAVHGFTAADGPVRFATVRPEQTLAEIAAEAGAAHADALAALNPTGPGNPGTGGDDTGGAAG
ncbi:diaminopimelate decarboxylase [Kitasatospora sp. DSM 101779]|uniref:diaminopimelate decarboxylase n=1 Tax=Kitasatospora sp. DSM 101779 TaxID=2853165 RepID=UPI0021DA1275|nr:diaminopimelate decarboxylase [Kitasatospora sp. DSM 101779]MCU7820574.1 diaminopimelate decarboxylase [Kitasatospora sp. DSM 101779]